MKFAFIRDNQRTFDIDVMCRVFDVTRAGFHAWLGRPESPRAARTRELGEQVRAVHHEANNVYGSIKIRSSRPSPMGWSGIWSMTASSLTRPAARA